MVLSVGRYEFAPRVLPTIAAIAFVALTVWLGRWQDHRAEEKQVRQSLFEERLHEAPVRLTGAVDSAEPLLFRRVTAAGRWMPGRQVFVDNQVHEGHAGFAVITPLRIAGSGAVVLVNRGWIARTQEYPRAPAVPVPAGEVEVSGLATVPPARFIELSKKEAIEGNVMQNITIARYRAWSGIDVLPVIVLADPPAAGLAAFTEEPDAGVAKHREYEFTWFSLAVTALALWLGLNVRRAR